jgi:hypothetical protein
MTLLQRNKNNLIFPNILLEKMLIPKIGKTSYGNKM